MPNLTKAAVTVKSSWTEGSVTGKRHVVLQCKATLAAQGSGAAGGKIPASAFELSEIIETSNFVADDATEIIPAVATGDGLEILLEDGALAPANATGTYHFTVRGQR